MAKSTHKKKKKKKSVVQKKDSLHKFGMIDSKFLARVRLEFLGPSAREKLWSEDFADVDDKELVGQDLVDAFRSLLLVQEIPGSAPLPGTPGSATRLIAEIIIATGWPNNDEKVPVPPPWKKHKVAFRRYEIASAVSIFMQAYNRLFAGGPRPVWPPDRP